MPSRRSRSEIMVESRDGLTLSTPWAAPNPPLSTTVRKAWICFRSMLPRPTAIVLQIQKLTSDISTLSQLARTGKIAAIGRSPMDRTGHNNPQPVDAAIVPRFGAIPTFMRLPYITEPTAVDIALIGVPWDGGTTNRAGARHGPREIRNMSSFMRKVHHVSRIAPYDLARFADLGDAPVNPIDLMDTLGRVERFYQKVHAAGALPLSAGGDHLITLPIFRAIAKDRPIGMVHFDAHSDTNDRYFGDNKYTHGTPFRRAIEEGVLDPKRTIQIGIRGSTYNVDDMEFAEEVGIRVVYMEEFTKLGVDKTIK